MLTGPVVLVILSDLTKLNYMYARVVQCLTRSQPSIAIGCVHRSHNSYGILKPAAQWRLSIQIMFLVSDTTSLDARHCSELMTQSTTAKSLMRGSGTTNHHHHHHHLFAYR